jgi:UDP-N-acetylglucosamine 2-epimerase
MAPAQTLSSVTSRILDGLHQVVEEEKPDMIVVQGDTTTTFAGALTGFYAGIPVAHVEAGLRTGDVKQPFPEEMNRVLTTRLATLHFPPTEIAKRNLIGEGVPDSHIVVTGNSGIDAALYVRDALVSGRMPTPSWPVLDSGKRLILVTVHRRESFGQPLRNICTALKNLARRADIQIIWPVHPNPNVGPVVEEEFRGYSNVVLLEPLSYVPFIDLMSRAYLLLTDSGGIQEEGPSFGKAVLVLREKTERPEAVHAGTAEVVGCDPQRIISAVSTLLDNKGEYQRRTFIHNPYGDGQASARIVGAMQAFLTGTICL